VVAVGGAIVEHETVDASAANAPPIEKASPPADGGASGFAAVVKGAGVRVLTKGTTEWKPLAAGSTELAAGDSLQVPAGADVDLRNGARHGRLVGTGRYVIGSADGALFRATSGHVELEATTEDVVVEVPGGTILVKAGDGKSRVDGDVGTTGTKITVRQGQAELRGAGTPETIRAGESATINPKGALALTSRGPERTDFTVHAGDSIVVRDPHPPTAVGFDLDSVCPGVAILSSGATSIRGERKVAIALGAGYHDYAIRCVGPEGVEEKTAASGTVTVVADAARAELPKLAPSTVVDMDGHRYTVLYQNLLPGVIARWPDAPPAAGYTLVVDSERTKSTTPKQSLKPGAIGEGTHTLAFETDDGSKKSAPTTLVIKFDNAAPTASVREPADGSFQPGDTVKVSGVVVEGSTVSVNGATVPLDPQKRFFGTATVPASENALVLKITHPKRGAVYYVRHASAAGGGR
jgi:hypothetical protein